ncbi:MAG: InlB B-repeat-containing protein [Lachnospiraceae bacterium]|nr:InlB B-repeat-containing protein [Lachnospiraceae bacterium]
MKKRRVNLLIAAVVLSLSVLYGCSGKDETQGGADDVSAKEQEAADSEEEKETQAFTVTFYDTDGTTVLSTEEVQEGAVATEYTPEKEEMVFMGWFATPSLGHVFDFSQPITADTEVFAGFMEDVEDTRKFAILGSGTSPLLSVSSWGKVIEDEHYLTKSENENVYSITLDLCSGDEFQFAIDSAWSNQRGGGYMTTTDLDGTSYFAVSGGLSENSQKSNIKCVVSGNYTFTLTTYPGADVYDTEDSYYSEETKENYNSNPYDKIEWTYNGEMESEQAELDTAYYIKGAIITGWEDKYDEQYAFTETDGIHTLTIDLEEGDEFLFTTLVTVDGNASVGNEYVRYSNITDKDSLNYVDGTESQNMVAKQAGTYTFTYDPDSTELTVTFAE